MRFRVSGLEESVTGKTEREVDLDLKYDVHFVTAHPCVPSQHTKILNPNHNRSITTGVSDGSVGKGGPSISTDREGPHELYCGKCSSC